MIDKLKIRARNAIKGFLTDEYVYYVDNHKGLQVMHPDDFFNNKERKMKMAGIKEGFNHNADIYSIINIISAAGANIPIKIYTLDRNGEKQEVLEGPFYDFMHKPNPETNYKQFMYQSLVNQLANGNTIEWAVKGLGESYFGERYNLAPIYVKVKAKESPTGWVAEGYKYRYHDKTYTYKPDEILHVRKYNPDPKYGEPYMGLSPLAAAKRSLDASNKTQTAESEALDNKSASGFITSRANRALKTEEKEQAEALFKERIGGAEKFGKIAVASGDLDYVNIGFTAQDIEILRSGVFKLRQLSAVYGMSSRKINDPEGTTYNNVIVDDKNFFNDAVLPPLELQITETNEFYAPGYEELEGRKLWAEVDKTKIESLQEDENRKAVRNRTKSMTASAIIEGVSSGKWDRASAIEQLKMALEINDAEANNLLGNVQGPSNEN